MLLDVAFREIQLNVGYLVVLVAQDDIFGRFSSHLPKCTVFEMIAGLAYRCEHQIMRNLSYGDRSKKWFYEMLENLGLMDFDNKSWDSESEDQVFNIVHDFLYRKYRVDGSGGGLFPIKRRSLNQKTEEIWVQCMAYLNENYVHEDDNELELYRNYRR